MGKPCGFIAIGCNSHLNSNQKAMAAAVQPFHNSEYRGWQLANQIENYMATTGLPYINITGHSQGGIDARKAAKFDYEKDIL